MPQLKPFYEYDEKDVLNMYVYDGSSGGNVSAPEVNDGNIGGNLISERYGIPMRKIETTEEIFGNTKFNKSFWDKIIETYNQGGFYHVSFYSEEESKKDLKIAVKDIYVCEIIEQFQSLVYDFFIRHYYDNTTTREHLIWGMDVDHRKNPHKNMPNFYIDGSVFYRMKEEYLEVLKYYTPDRLLSFIINFNGGFTYTAQYK